MNLITLNHKNINSGIKWFSIIIALLGFPFPWLLSRGTPISSLHIYKHNLVDIFFDVFTLAINFFIIFFILNKVQKLFSKQNNPVNK